MSICSSEIIYFTEPGDNLTKILAKHPRRCLGNDPRNQIEKFMLLNPHLSNPNRIQIGEVLRLGPVNEAAEPSPAFAADLRELGRAWRGAENQTREIIQKNFDVIEWISSRRRELKFVDTFGAQAKDALREIGEFRLTGAMSGRAYLLSNAYRELLVVRNSTVAELGRYRIPILGQPIILLNVSTNPLHAYAQSMLKMIDRANRIRLGKKLTVLQWLLEGEKVVETGIRTKDLGKTAKQAVKGGLTVGVGYFAGLGAKAACKTAFQMSNKKAGALVCLVSIGVAMTGGKKVVDTAMNLFFGPPVEMELPQLR